MTDTILPPNSSVLERDIEESGGKARIEAIDVPVGKLWNPQTIPAAILPYLAWALSVDTWDNEWPDNIKRQVIAASVEVHRKKGTVGAVKKAIAAIGIDVDFEEWFQNGGIPHTFTITAWSNNNRDEEDKTKLLPAAFNDINKGVNATKPVRAHFELRFGSRVPLGAGMAADSHVPVRLNDATEIVPYPNRSNSLSGAKFDTHAPARASDKVEVIPYTSKANTAAGGAYDPHVPARAEHVNEILPYPNKSGSEVGGGYSSHVTARAAGNVEVIPYKSKANTAAGGGYDSHVPSRAASDVEVIPYASKSGTTAGTQYSHVAAARAAQDFEVIPYTNSTDAGFGVIGSLPVIGRLNITMEIL